jgi:hypothetical protein
MAVGIQSTTGVDWESLPSSMYEFGNYSVEIDFDITASTLQNYTIDITGVTLAQVNNPSGCTFNATFIFCPSSGEPNLQITPNAVSLDTNFTWVVTTYDSSDGIEVWNLSLEILNDNLVPTFSSISPARYTIINDTNVTITVIGSDAQNSIANATFYYLPTQFIQYSVYNASTQSSLFTCIGVNCSYTFSAKMLLNLTNNESYLNGYVELTDLAGNSNNSAQYNFYVDSTNPTISNISVTNATVIASDSFSVSYSVDDDAFSLPVGFSAPDILCELYIDALIYNSTTINFSQTIVQSASLVALVEGAHEWNTLCIDSVSNTQKSSTYTFFIDRSGPIVTLINTTNGSIVELGSLINIEVNDTYGTVDSVWLEYNAINYSLSFPYTLNTSYFVDGNISFSIYANDSFGILSKKDFSLLVDGSAPIISNISVVEVTSSSLNLSWILSENATNILYYSTNQTLLLSNYSAALFALAPTGLNISFLLTGLGASTQYFYFVQACDTFNFCANSSIKNITTIAVASSSSSGGGGGGSSSTKACYDKKDNDGDGLIDYPDDPGCVSRSDPSEINAPVIVELEEVVEEVQVDSDTQESDFEQFSTAEDIELLEDIVEVSDGSNAGLITGAFAVITDGSSGSAWFLIFLVGLVGLFLFVAKRRRDKKVKSGKLKKK